MHYKDVEKLKAYAFELSALAAEMVAVFMANDVGESENEREQKKIPKTALSVFRNYFHRQRRSRKTTTLLR